MSMGKICIIGGKLQGFEVTYLAHKADIDVLLIDRKENPFIRSLVDTFCCFDIIEHPEKLIDISKLVDAIIPVNENPVTIEFLNNIKKELSCPLLFDFGAYFISMDKKRSKDYFRSLGILAPQDKPEKPPYFVKPPCDSSSVGTSIIYSDRELEGLDPSMLIEEYVKGNIISLEVVGDGSNFTVVKETRIHIDDTYDCHMVTPIGIYPGFRNISYQLAKNISLKGIMDVEAIDSPDGLKVIEIDARFPSQTPTVVYHSTGINMVEILLKAFSEGVTGTEEISDSGYCIYEHLMQIDGDLIPVGEHVLSQGEEYAEFYICEDFEIFESRAKDQNSVFTVISLGADPEEAEKVRSRAILHIKELSELIEKGDLNGTFDT